MRILYLWIIMLLPFCLKSQATPKFQEDSGLVIIEIESAAEYSNWELDTINKGFTGKGYLHYRGADFFNTPGNSLLTFKVVIEKTGRYRFQWRSRIAQGTSNTEHNDSWLRFRDASDFYGEKDGARVYPKGVGKTPNPEGSTKDGWMKIYQNTRSQWTWQTRTSDNDPHNIFVEFDSAGVYTIEIAGRSNGHAIDRLVLYHGDVSNINALSLFEPESERLESVGYRNIQTNPDLKIMPTTTQQRIRVAIPNELVFQSFKMVLIDSFGKLVRLDENSYDRHDRFMDVEVNNLTSGHYFLKLYKSDIEFKGRFVKI